MVPKVAKWAKSTVKSYFPSPVIWLRQDRTWCCRDTMDWRRSLRKMQVHMLYGPNQQKNIGSYFPSPIISLSGNRTCRYCDTADWNWYLKKTQVPMLHWPHECRRLQKISWRSVILVLHIPTTLALWMGKKLGPASNTVSSSLYTTMVSTPKCWDWNKENVQQALCYMYRFYQVKAIHLPSAMLLLPIQIMVL